jgi:hypothetical protein
MTHTNSEIVDVRKLIRDLCQLTTWRSPWDVMHPGRLWALDNRLEDSLTHAEIIDRIAKTLLKMPPRKDHPALLEEMLAGFRQDEGVAEEEAVPPVGEEAAGPEADEEGED